MRATRMRLQRACGTSSRAPIRTRSEWCKLSARPKSACPGSSARNRERLQGERDLAVLAVGPVYVQRQRPVLVDRFGQEEDRHRALDRAEVGGRVEHRDLFFGLDLTAKFA